MATLISERYPHGRVPPARILCLAPYSHKFPRALTAADRNRWIEQVSDRKVDDPECRVTEEQYAVAATLYKCCDRHGVIRHALSTLVEHALKGVKSRVSEITVRRAIRLLAEMGFVSVHWAYVSTPHGCERSSSEVRLTLPPAPLRCQTMRRKATVLPPEPPMIPARAQDFTGMMVRKVVAALSSQQSSNNNGLPLFSPINSDQIERVKPTERKQYSYTNPPVPAREAATENPVDLLGARRQQFAEGRIGVEVVRQPRGESAEWAKWRSLSLHRAKIEADKPYHSPEPNYDDG